MTLVERLRNFSPSYSHVELELEAADEIERLQQQVTDLTNLIDTVMAIPKMTDAQLEELANNCKKVIKNNA